MLLESPSIWFSCSIAISSGSGRRACPRSSTRLSELTQLIPPEPSPSVHRSFQALAAPARVRSYLPGPTPPAVDGHGLLLRKQESQRAAALRRRYRDSWCELPATPLPRLVAPDC